MTNTNTAAAGACILWVLTDAIKGQVSISGACSGLIAGLATVTPAAGYIQPGYALLIGCIGSAIIYWGLKLKARFLHIDDTLDVFSCHGVSGIVGTFCTGLFCELDVNPQGADGAFFGNPLQLWKQIAAILVTVAFAAVCTAGILLPMHLTFGIKLDAEDQIIGMDMLSHGEWWHGPTGLRSRSAILNSIRAVGPNNLPTPVEMTIPLPPTEEPIQPK